MGTKSNKAGFKSVEPDFEELDAKIQEHRKKIFWRIISVIIIVAIVFVAYQLWSALRAYSSYEVRNSIERTDSKASQFEYFQDNILKYSNDGIVYMNSENELIWNQAFEMTAPQIDICKEYLVVYDKNGTNLYIMNTKGPVKHLEMTRPIQSVCIAEQGTIAVLMKEGVNSYIRLYDKYGETLANGEFFGDQGGFPMDIAFSYDAKKLAVAMVDINGGNVKSTITFYNFGTVGQNEIDNNVGMYSYSDMLIPEIEYISNDRMVAFGDNEILIFEGAQKPKVAEEILLEKDIESIFYNEKYIGVSWSNQDENATHHIKVYGMNGSVVMENDTAMAYDRIEFLANNEICVTNEYECELYTIHSIKKFSYVFDTEIYKILSQDGYANYIFIRDGITEEVHLQ